MKMKESEMVEKVLDLARRLRKLWNMKVDVLETVPKGMERRLKKLEMRIETIQTAALLKSASSLRLQ